MPFKHNLTKFNIFSDSVHKIAKKSKITENEKRIAIMAIITKMTQKPETRIEFKHK